MGVYVYAVRKKAPHTVRLPNGRKVKVYRSQFIGLLQDSDEPYLRRKTAQACSIWRGQPRPLCVEGTADDLEEGQAVREAVKVVHDDIEFDKWIIGHLRLDGHGEWIIDPTPFEYEEDCTEWTRLNKETGEFERMGVERRRVPDATDKFEGWLTRSACA